VKRPSGPGVAALAVALHNASDHLPVVADYSLSGACPADVSGDGIVAVPDFVALLGAWGSGPCGPPDLNGDGNVGVPNLLTLLAAWGACQ